jgi:hypothetical protein
MPRTSLVRFVVLAAVTGTSLACGGAATDDPNLTKKVDGGATGDGKTCSLAGVSWSGSLPSQDTRVYAVGETFKAPDGCNDCTCTPAGASCTTQYGPSARTCNSPIRGVCTVGGVTHESGEEFPCPDGCNTCWCTAGGRVAQTLMACTRCVPPREPPPEAVCTGAIVYAKDPDGGSCCRYASACNAPSSWKTYGSEGDCVAARD